VSYTGIRSLIRRSNQLLQLALISLAGLNSYAGTPSEGAHSVTAQVSVSSYALSFGSQNLTGVSFSGKIGILINYEWNLGLTYAKAIGGLDYSFYTFELEFLYHLPKWERRVFIGPILGYGQFSTVDPQSRFGLISTSGMLLGAMSGCDFWILKNISLGPQLKLMYLTTDGSITAIDGSLFLKLIF
jgi:hypothetical protein